jgi:lipopolysaccharide-induced tumor necrosis factor-alpha factor
MYCSKCGAQQPDGTVFCTQCGAPQTPKAPESAAGTTPPGTAPPLAGAAAPAYGVFTCPFCRFQGPPIVERKLSQNGWIVFVLLLIFCLPLCWLPFVIDGCKEDQRKCASCGTRLG